MKKTLEDDLSIYHELLTDLFPSMPAEEAWDKFKLSDKQVEFYREYGYVSNIKLLDEAQVQQLRDELDEIKNPLHPKNYLFHEKTSTPEEKLFHIQDIFLNKHIACYVGSDTPF